MNCDLVLVDVGEVKRRCDIGPVNGEHSRNRIRKRGKQQSAVKARTEGIRTTMKMSAAMNRKRPMKGYWLPV